VGCSRGICSRLSRHDGALRRRLDEYRTRETMTNDGRWTRRRLTSVVGRVRVQVRVQVVIGRVVELVGADGRDLERVLTWRPGGGCTTHPAILVLLLVLRKRASLDAPSLGVVGRVHHDGRQRSIVRDLPSESESSANHLHQRRPSSIVHRPSLPLSSSLAAAHTSIDVRALTRREL
jgi:hypothetical protein